MQKTFKQFRILGIVEGFSLLILLFIAMPLKYYADMKGVVPIVGTIHGILFLSFMFFSLNISHKLNWSILFWLLVFFSSVIPGGTFLMDLKLKKMKIEQN